MIDFHKLFPVRQAINDEHRPPVQSQLILFGVGWLGLNFIALLVATIIKAILTKIYVDPLQLQMAIDHISYGATINIVSYFILLALLVTLSFPTLRSIAKNFYRLNQVIKGIGYGALVLLAGIALNYLYIVFKIQLTDNANEATITAIMRNYPLFSFIAFVIAGPVCEEITYRLGLFGFLARFNRVLAYVVTLLFFGLIHFDFTTHSIVNELLNLPFYVMAGLIFCYVYEHEGLAVVMYAHVTNNLVSFVFSLINTDILLRMV